MVRILNWFKDWSPFGWGTLAFGDRLKLVALFIQLGAGIAMTAFAAYSLWTLANLNAVWPVFYMGALALGLVAIVLTGFGALIYKRNVELEVFGVKFKAADQEAARAMAGTIETIASNANSNAGPTPESK